MLDYTNHRSRSNVSEIVKIRPWYVQDKAGIARLNVKKIPRDFGGSAFVMFSRNMKNVKGLVFQHERHSF